MTCKHPESIVINVRHADSPPRPPARPGFDYLYYRRRECKKCGDWFTTYEITEK